MYKINDIVVHKRDICKVTKILKKYMNDEDYYTLIPIEDCSLVIKTPVSNNAGMIRDVITKKDALSLIKKIPKITIIELNDQTLEKEYTALLKSAKHEDLIKIIKTAHLRRQEKLDNGQKGGIKDKTFQEQAEKMIYAEFAVSLDKTIPETKEYISKNLKK